MDHAAPTGDLFLIPAPIASVPEWRFDETTAAAIRSCRTIVCERVRTTRRLIKYLFNQDEFDDLHFIEMNKHDPGDYVKMAMDDLKSGRRTAIFSEAGMPCIADPGHLLVQAAHRVQLRVHPFPGPNSFMMALMASGLNGQTFTFHGYLPRDSEGLKHALQQIEKSVLRTGSSQIFMETPYRNQKLFETVIKYVRNTLFLNISIDISGTQQRIETAPIKNWNKESTIFIEKLPAVFIIGRP